MLRNGGVSEVTCVCVSVCLTIDGPESDSRHIVEREKELMEEERIRGGRVVAFSSSLVNIDTVRADPVPAVLINHFQWTHTNTLSHTQAQAERGTTHKEKI